MEKKRNIYIDMVKGTAIFLMLWGHCIQYCVAGTEMDFFENFLFKTIYSFHMPLFMLVSGYLFFYSFSKRSMKELLIHRTQSLLHPIVFGSLFIFLATTALANALNGKAVAIFDGAWLCKLSSLWFLWSVLVASLATTLACKTQKKLPAQVLLFLVMIPLIALFPNASLNIYMYPYFILGFYFAKFKDKLPQWVHRAKYASLLLFPLMLCFYEKKHYIYITGLLPDQVYSLMDMLLIDAYRWLIGLVGSVFALTLLDICCQHVLLKVKRTIISAGLAALGEKSLQIYVLSVPFLSMYLSAGFPKILSVLKIHNIFATNIVVYNFVFTFLLAVSYALALYCLTKLLEKLNLSRIIFGK